MPTDNEIWQQWHDAIISDIEEAKQNPENIRYYKGQYKVVVMPKSKDVFFKGYRCVAALEDLPHDGIKMIIQENEQFSTSTRYLQINKSNEMPKQ